MYGQIRSYGDCSSASYVDPADVCKTVIGNRAGSTQFRLTDNPTGTNGYITASGTGGLGSVTATPGSGWNATSTTPGSPGMNPNPTGALFPGTVANEVCMVRTAIVDSNNHTVSVWPPFYSTDAIGSMSQSSSSMPEGHSSTLDRVGAGSSEV